MAGTVTFFPSFSKVMSIVAGVFPGSIVYKRRHSPGLLGPSTCRATKSLALSRYFGGLLGLFPACRPLTDQQTLLFHPDLYLDIAQVRDLKHRALTCHESQKPEEVWQVHEAMHRRRGKECGAPQP